MSLLHEWPLVVFTLASQVAVGSFLALLVVWGTLRAGGKGSSPSAKDVEAVAGWSQQPLLFVGIMTVVGLTASFLHLGAPLNALRALSNVGHSWLSREILAALAFLGVWVLGFRFLRHPQGAPSWLLPSLALALAMAGVLLIWTMARVYMLPARPAWDSWLTPGSFFLAAVLLGASAIATHLARHPLPSLRPGTKGPELPLLSMALAAALAQLAVASFHPVTESLRASGSGATFANARILLLLAGALVITAALARTALGASGALRASGASVASGASGASVTSKGSGDLGALRTSGISEAMRGSRFGATPGPQARSGFWTALALLLLLASETLGRMLFYAVGTADPF
jgi:anaerobic dimethyl sulfoxide reductase subunit C